MLKLQILASRIQQHIRSIIHCECCGWNETVLHKFVHLSTWSFGGKPEEPVGDGGSTSLEIDFGLT